MPVDVALLSLDNPVFHTYVLTASLMILKLMLQPWMTVYRMLHIKGGFRSPEDARRSPMNPQPDASQLEANEYVERSRRINLNDLESIPAFLVAGLLLVLVEPSPLLAQGLMWGYVVARAAHFLAYITAQIHDIRATFWTLSSLAVIAMIVCVLLRVL
ncbi:glutathione S-transferase [Marinobacterium nitratireducens]|uniref:Microsomal glutathione S-transferase 1 n=1 Tax=Marinobacterium nitratireducens TaxID=518897 RepID=A0A917ZHM9_9GAMM|nr:MAPEG family protein [Marinobacterium nitratireducens]GGO83495.1 glutathione S-transferase [Marinobacterium nitratireducens]